MQTLLIVGLVGVAAGAGAAWLLGGEDNFTYLAAGAALGAGGTYLYLKNR